jgi:two-component system sensor histidine kinase FlrB
MAISSITSSRVTEIPALPVTFEERSLVRAFALFTDAAASLERSYAHLQAEVARLGHQLEDTNRDLSLSLEQNHRTRQHLDRILEGLPCGVLVMEPGGGFSIANPEAQRLLELRSLGGDSHTPAWAADLLRSTRAEFGEREYQHAGPGIEWLAVRRAQLPADEGGSSIFILRDISESKRLERTQEIFRRRQALAEMSTVLAHEIRNPLGSLELFAGLLADSGLEAERLHWVEQMRAGLRTLAGTVNNVLHFNGDSTIELSPTDLGQWLRGLEEFLRPLAGQAGVEILSEQQLDGVMIAADRQRLDQVGLNLAINAFRFMPGGGTLKISGQLLTAGGRAEVEFTDSGPGISEPDRGKIFELGFSTRGSAGLGLAVCKTIVEQHHGNIRVGDPSQPGTTFQIEFPLLGAQA